MNVWKGKYGPLLVAEIGGNHEGNFEYAKKLTQLAIASQADYVKFQIYSGDSIANKVVSPDRNLHFKKFELSREQHISLAEMCLQNGKGYMASVWDMDAFDWIDPFLTIYKIGSGDLTAYPFLKKVGSTGKPIILSTGLARLDEIEASIEYLTEINPVYKQKDKIALLQCTAMYPIPFSDANLEVMNTLRKRTGYVTGYSDHTEGSIALETAFTMGAEILEFHFTDSRENKKFRDHKVSLTLNEVNQLVQKIEWINTLKGNSEKRPLDIESDHLTSFRRAVYPAMNILKGTIIKKKHLHVLRPNEGIDARYYDQLIGKKTRLNLKENQKLDWEYFE